MANDVTAEADRPDADGRQALVPPPSKSGAPHEIIRAAISRAVFKRAKEIYSDGLIALFYVREDDWPGLRAGLRRYAVARARADVIGGHLGNAYAGVLAALLTGGSIWVGMLLDYASNPIAFFVVAGAAFLATMAIVGAIADTVPSGMLQFYTLAVMLLTSVAIISGTIFVDRQGLQHPWDPLPKHGGPLATMIAGGFVMCAAQVAIIALSLLAIGITDFAIASAFARRRPDIVITGTLITLLRNLHRSPQRFDTVHVKGLVCRDLERLALYLQPRAGDGAAGYVRLLQARVTMSEGSIVPELRAAIAHYVAVFTVGNYGLLPTGNAGAAKRKTWAKIYRATKALIVAVIPIGCLIAARAYGIRLSGPLSDAVVVIALLWAAIGLLSVLDPAYRARMDGMSKVTLIFQRIDD